MPLYCLSVLPRSVLGDVHDADLQHLVGLGVVDEIVQSAPRAFELLEVLVVQDQVDLLGELPVELGDDRLDRLDDVRADQLGLRQRLLGERAHGLLDRLLRLVGLGLELLLQQLRELAALERAPSGCVVCCCVSAMVYSSGPYCRARRGLAALRRPAWRSPRATCSSAGSLSTFAISSSAPLLPSM